MQAAAEPALIMEYRRGNSMHCLRGMIVLTFGATTLVGCGQGDVANNSATIAAPPSTSTPMVLDKPSSPPTGLTPEEERSILQAAVERLSTRQYGMLSPRKMCTDVFGFGDPSLSDVFLGSDTGKIKVVVPIFVHTPLGSPGNQWVPADDCYGLPSNTHFRDRTPIRTAFEFNVEHWQSGWRLAQPRPGEF